MGMMDKIYRRAKADPKRIAFPEATDEKILQAVSVTAREGIGRPVLVGRLSEISAAASARGADIEKLSVFDMEDEEALARLIDRYAAGNAALSRKTLKRRSADPLYVALMLEAVGEADCTFAGINHTTGEVILAAQTIIGLAEGVDTASSIGIMDIPGYDGPEGSLLAFGDSAVCAEPTPDELASIAIAACETVKALLRWEPRCAMLSFSTAGSAEHPSVEKVVEAVKIANARRLELKIDGEFQLDAAIVPKIAEKKVKRPSDVAGRANIIIYPDLNAGNIGVKLVQQFAKADAYGPILQGFAKIVSDCSRGAPVSELVGNIAITAVRAQSP